MTAQSPVAAVTGASGYLGSQICQTLESRGWQIIRLTGSPARSHGQAVSYNLAAPITAQVSEALQSADVLIHAAYDLSLTSSVDIWRVNVEGTRRLLEAAKEAGTGRIIVLSSMSAFTGTSQLYGRAKLDIEAITVQFGGCAVRPGLVHGKGAGGMTGALRKLTGLPIVPVIAGGAGLYTVWEDDLMRAIALLASATTLEPGTISLALSRQGDSSRYHERPCSRREPSQSVCACALAIDLLAAADWRAYAPASAVPGRLAAGPGAYSPRPHW